VVTAVTAVIAVTAGSLVEEAIDLGDVVGGAIDEDKTMGREERNHSTKRHTTAISRTEFMESFLTRRRTILVHQKRSFR